MEEAVAASDGFLLAHSQADIAAGCDPEDEMADVPSQTPASSPNFARYLRRASVITLPIGLWGAVLVADVGLWWTRVDGWATAGRWLLGAAIGAAATATAGLNDHLEYGDIQRHAIGNAIAVVVSLFNLVWRYRFGAASVLPAGLVLSFGVVGIILFTAWSGGAAGLRHRIELYGEPRR